MATTERKVEGIHIGFLRKITGKRERRLRDGKWETPRVEGVREAAGMQVLRTYIDRRKATLDRWVELSPLF